LQLPMLVKDVRGLKILPTRGKGPRTIKFDMYCGTHGAADCSKQQCMTDLPFELDEQPRSRVAGARFGRDALRSTLLFVPVG
jgi:hypothetical protein